MCKAESLQESHSCGEAEAAVGSSKFFYQPQIPKLHNQAALVGVEEPVDFRLADWLLKGDTSDYFERSGS